MNNLFRAIPGIYGLLIFIGYLNYHSFYSVFDIEISAFLTGGELILSFLPLSLPILIITGIITYLLYLVMVVYANHEESATQDQSKERKISYWHYVKQAYRLIRVKETYKSANRIFSLLHYTIIGLISILFFIWFAIITLKVVMLIDDKNPAIYDIRSIVILVIVVWYIYIASSIESSRVYDESVRNVTKFVVIVLLFITTFSIINVSKARKIIAGQSFYTYQIEYEDGTIYKPDTNTVYIGMVNNYVFIRDVKESQNIILSRDNIKAINLKKEQHKSGVGVDFIIPKWLIRKKLDDDNQSDQNIRNKL